MIHILGADNRAAVNLEIADSSGAGVPLATKDRHMHSGVPLFIKHIFVLVRVPGRRLECHIRKIDL